MKQYKAVFIDWDDTIGDFHGAAQRALHEMYLKYELNRFFVSCEEFVAIYKPHNIELWSLYGEGSVTKGYLSLDRFLFPLFHGTKTIEKIEQGLLQVSILPVLAQQLSNDFLALTTAYFALLPGAEKVVRYLASKYPLTIVTNGFIEVQYEKFQKSGLRDCFSHIVLSEEVGCQKPNARIFEEALRQNGLQAEDVVMIGDSWNSDIQGAINAGIDQIWIRKNKEQGTKSLDTIEQTATHIVQSLSEVMEIL